MMMPKASTVRDESRIQRVRAILLTGQNSLLLIKRIKPSSPTPYWVAPGGGVEASDQDLEAALARELLEELGARIEVLSEAFVLRHEKAGKRLEEHFFICRLLGYDLSLRHGPEFEDPTRGQYLPDVIELTPTGIRSVYMQTYELKTWLLENLAMLRRL